MSGYILESLLLTMSIQKAMERTILRVYLVIESGIRRFRDLRKQNKSTKN